MFHIESQHVARNTKIQILSKNSEKRKNRQISRFFPTLSTYNSVSLGSTQVSFHLHVDMIAVNGSSKGQPDWVNGADIMEVQA